MNIDELFVQVDCSKGFNNILSTIHSNQSWSKFTHARPTSNGFSMPPEPASKGHLCRWNKSLKPQRSQGKTFKSLLFFGHNTHGYTWDVSKFGTTRQSLEMIGLCWCLGELCFVCLFLIFVSIQNSSEIFVTLGSCFNLVCNFLTNRLRREAS